MTLLDASAVGVTSNPRAGLQGRFYWNGTGTGSATDSTGHVQASIHIQFNATTKQPEAAYFVNRCIDAACNSQTAIASATIMPVSFFEVHRLKVSYDGAVFSFQVDAGTPIVVAAPDVPG